ncbi:MAG TPA: glutamate--cysteine ligase, partial [Rubrivivax sp.]|nr:glutamate--cysteine ligase [Rubrivivax sp.]
FQACRFGLDGEIVDPKTHTRHKLRDDILRTLARVAEHALDLHSLEANHQIRDSLLDGNDASWLRAQQALGAPLAAVVEAASARWMMK